MRHAFKILIVLLSATLLTGSVCLGQVEASAKEGKKKGASYTVKLKIKPRVGSYLTDAKGMSLYYYNKDAPGKSACGRDCIVKWPVFYTKNVVVSKKLDKKDFAVITRGDGIKQTTYKGQPLYYFANDAVAGDTNGDGFNNLWHLIYILKIRR
jgi:predicted lipoprotein with Yx(FWY)xxD motif